MAPELFERFNHFSIIRFSDEVFQLKTRFMLDHIDADADALNRIENVRQYGYRKRA